LKKIAESGKSNVSDKTLCFLEDCKIQFLFLSPSLYITFNHQLALTFVLERCDSGKVVGNNAVLQIYAGLRSSMLVLVFK